MSKKPPPGLSDADYEQLSMEERVQRILADLPDDQQIRALREFDRQRVNRVVRDMWDVKETGEEDDGFRLVSARELAQPVRPMRWLIRRFWAEGSAGVLGADKKTFKTWNLQAMGLGVASGRPLFDEFEISTPGGVLYLAGEGGREAFQNRHQVIAARYGLTGDELAEVPFHAEFGVGSLSEKGFTATVSAYLDALQPKLVILDPLYAYHPQDVETSNLYARGQMLANLRELVGSEAALAIGDHFKKTATGGLDLDNIGMSGMSQWADSWVLQKHRESPDLENDEYRLYLETGTRRGGGRCLELDWSLEPDRSNPDTLMWKSVDWAVRPVQKKTSAKADGGLAGSKTEHNIEQVLRDHPYEFTQTQVVKEIGGNRDRAFATLDAMLKRGCVEPKLVSRTEGKRAVPREVLGLVEPAPKIKIAKDEAP